MKQPEQREIDRAGWTVPDDFEQSIPARFAQQARIHRDRTAIVSDTWQPTYEQLNDSSSRIALALLACNAVSGDRVAVLLPHDSPLIAGVLGVLKAGMVAVVMSLSHPPARRQQILEHAEAWIILTDQTNLPLARETVAAAASHARVVCVDEYLNGARTAMPGTSIAPGDNAFLIYTSGSTSAPKAVVRSHRAAIHNAFRHARSFDIRPDDRLLLVASLNAGSGVSLTLTALLSGATVCPFPVMDRGVTGLADWIHISGVSVFSSSSSLFRSFMRVAPDNRLFSNVRLVRLSSESATRDDVAAYRRCFPTGCQLVHTLSSSETGNLAHLHLTEEDLVGDGKLPVGVPAADVEVLVLDEHGQPVRQGEVGELTARSRYLSSGYWRDAKLTAEKFSFSNGVITFRSGDLARINSAGLIEFAGRSDGRLKIRGYRIEPAEVEGALRRHPAITEAVAGEGQRGNGDPRFVACLTCRDGMTVSAGDLREWLRDLVPSHAIPSDFVFLDQFPISPNGKIDRARLREQWGKLPACQSDSQAGSLRHEPQTPTETALANIWADVFERDVISRDDDFFDLGGDSLMAAVIAARIHAESDVELPLSAFVTHSTLADLADAVDQLESTRCPSRRPTIVAVTRDEPLPMSFSQERAWKYSQTPESSLGYTISRKYLIRGPLDVNAFRESYNYVVGRHEILRTTFEARDGFPVQVVHPPEAAAFGELDFSHLSDAEEQAELFFSNQAKTAFDLSRFPIWRVWLIRISQDHHWLLRVNHHLISDNWSTREFLSEWSSVYGAMFRGDPLPLPPLAPLQYGDYAVWQRRVLYADPAAYQDSIQWWKNHYSGNPRPLRLPFRRRHYEPNAEVADSEIHHPIDCATWDRLNEIAGGLRASRFIVSLAAVAAVLGESEGRTDVTLGTMSSNRNSVQLHGMLGCFINPLGLRLRFDWNWSFRHWITVVRDLMADVQQHSDIPYEQLGDELRKQGVDPPAVEMNFRIKSAADAAFQFGEAQLSRDLDVRRSRMPHGFTLVAEEIDRERGLRAVFDARRFDPSGVADMLDSIVRFLDVALKHSERSLRELLASSKRHSVHSPRGVRIPFWPFRNKVA